MPRSIRRLLVPEAMLVFVAATVLAAYVPAFAGLLNVHSAFGAAVLLVLLAFCVIAVVWLAFAVPLQAFAIARGKIERTLANVVVVLAGGILAVVFGGWFVVTFVLRS
jgi:hypothetical protein